MILEVLHYICCDDHSELTTTSINDMLYAFISQSRHSTHFDCDSISSSSRIRRRPRIREFVDRGPIGSEFDPPLWGYTFYSPDFSGRLLYIYSLRRPSPEQYSVKETELSFFSFRYIGRVLDNTLYEAESSLIFSFYIHYVFL